jgi:hypothetical protein
MHREYRLALMAEGHARATEAKRHHAGAEGYIDHSRRGLRNRENLARGWPAQGCLRDTAATGQVNGKP